MTNETLRAVADKLVACCRDGRESEALDTLYHPDAVSVEAAAMPGMDSRETRGLAGIKAKHDWWNGAFEVHGSSVDGPYPHGDDRFAVIFEVDASSREDGERFQMKEVGVYSVNDGKIVREEFFYPTG